MRLLLLALFILPGYSGSTQIIYEQYYGVSRHHPASVPVYPVDYATFNRDYGFFNTMPLHHRERELERYTNIHLLTTEQIRQLGVLLGNDHEKSAYLSNTYRHGRVYDIQNYGNAGSVFATQGARDAFFRFIHRKGLDYNGNRDDYDRHYNYQNPPNAPGVPGVHPPPRPSNDPYLKTPGNGRPNPQTAPYPIGGNGGGNVGVAMSAAEFQQAKRAIKEKSFDSGKLETAKSLVQSHYLSVNQLIELNRLFIYDDNRLEFSKYAYDRTVDKQNYGQLSNELTLASNKKDFEQFLAQKGVK